jgi:hypothetical protein
MYPLASAEAWPDSSGVHGSLNLATPVGIAAIGEDDEIDTVGAKLSKRRCWCLCRT